MNSWKSASKWLDDERRKDKTIISELENRLLKLEDKLNAVDMKTREYDSDLTRLRTSVTRVDDFEADLGVFRVDRKKDIKEQDEKLEKLYPKYLEIFIDRQVSTGRKYKARHEKIITNEDEVGRWCLEK